MVKNNSKFSKTRKSLIAALCAVTVTCTGLAAACSNTPGESGDDSKSFKREDTVQLLKNGTFENYSIPKDAVYLIKNTDGWSRSGDSSNAMSGIIGTSDKSWGALTDADLSHKLDYNNDLDSSSESYEDEYVDYNGMKTRDMLYKDTYSALIDTTKENAVADSFISKQGYETYFGITEDSGKYYFNGKEVIKNPDDENDIDYYFKNEDGSLGECIRLALIDNPGTHYNIQKDNDGWYFMDGSNRVTVYEDEESGDFYRLSAEVADEGDDNKEFISNVLMVHNYPTDNKYNGIQQYYSSETITLEANTAAEISLWVKTSELRFDKGYSQLNDQDRGAFIEVTQTVNGSSVSSFKIKAINTEKIIADSENSTTAALDDKVVSNGWLKYTIYVNACDFGESNISLNLGLGHSGKNGNDYSEKCTGYAFFDDVTVTKFRSLEDDNCTYSANASTIQADKTSCTLVTDAENKVFIADRALSDRNMTGYTDKKRNCESFYYLVDLASENGDITDSYSSVNFTNSNTTVDFTTEKVTSHGVSKYYSSANTAPGKIIGVANGFGSSYVLPENLPQFRNTAGDLIGAFAANKTFQFTGYGLASILNKDLLGENGLTGLPKYDENTTDNNLFVINSANGAAYTATISATEFTVDAGEYRIVSFWVKTSDMDGKTAATVKITDGKNEEKTISIDSTGKTTDFGDTEKDIYNGWVQCFFFVENNTDQNGKTFKIEFSFGNTEIASTTDKSYKYGWAALANMQTLSFDKEDIYSLGSDGDYSQKFTITEDDEDNSEKPFDTPSGTSNIAQGIASPANYDGVNGSNSAVAKNNNAGLINRDDFDSYTDKTYILSMFNAANWAQAFENDGYVCYQPLVILDTIRAYADSASANADTYTNYYIEATDGTIEIEGKKYRKATTADGYDETQTYYSLSKNYGFTGANSSVSADSYQTVSVNVLVSTGAVAYVYLVDSKSRDVLGYSTPVHTFYYDEEGNVLDAEFDENWTDGQHKSHVVYTTLPNGLYKDTDGTVRANLYNLTKSYTSLEFEHGEFYTDTTGDESSKVSYDDLENGEIYYNADGKEVDHYLVNSAGIRVYKFVNGKYYYIVNDEVSSQVVENFEEKYANPDATINEEYFVKVEDTNGKWVTVSFFIHTGSEAKDYRLELWSGVRNEAGDVTTGANGAVAFDYSHTSISEEEDFNNARSFYESEIIEEYKKILLENGGTLKNDNIAYYEAEIAKLVENGTINQSAVDEITKKYTARYYSYVLYDDDSYIPFNEEVAGDGETGYDYKITDEKYAEKLAFLKYEDETSRSIFIDYSAVDQNIERGTNTDDGDDDGGEAAKTDWLIITSIILVVALLFALVSILVRDLIKKLHKKQGVKSQSKNMYRKRERYIKKLHLVKNEEESPVEETSAPEETATETPDGEAPSEEPKEEIPAAPSEEKVEEPETAEEETTETEKPSEDE